MDAFEIFGPQQLHDFTRTEIVVMRGRTGRRTDAAVQASVQFMVVAQVALYVLKNLFEFFAPDYVGVRDRVTNVFLYSRCGRM
jgi:hypothetical protein